MVLHVSILLSSIKRDNTISFTDALLAFQYYLVLLKVSQDCRAIGPDIQFQYYLVLLKDEKTNEYREAKISFNTT